MTYFEVQCDGIVGPTHHYGGLSHGNVASAGNAQTASYPRKAALQGLEKMALVHSLGCKQVVIPPHVRPNRMLLKLCGFDGDLQDRLDAAYEQAPEVLSECYSSAHMWVANMATVSPAVDAQNGILHLTPANLASTLHRAQEAEQNYTLLKIMFGDAARVHKPLPACVSLTDEGAANHMRFCGKHGDAGVEVFVYGKEAANADAPSPSKYPARQTYESVKMLARSHHLADERTVFIQQTPEAIDAGVFHNDVIAMSNENLLIHHEKAFLDSDAKISEINDKLGDISLNVVMISEDALPLADAVSSYFFNSQILSLPDGTMAIIAPAECKENSAAYKAMEALCDAKDNPISIIYYRDLRESMKNGGGPACLRLRVAMNEQGWQQMLPSVKYSEALHKQIENIINEAYLEKITFDDLRNAVFFKHSEQTTQKLYNLLLNH